MEEISALAKELRGRIESLGVTEEIAMHPKGFHERTVVNGLYSCAYRIVEEAANLDFATMTRFPDVPWGQVRGLRKRRSILSGLQAPCRAPGA